MFSEDKNMLLIVSVVPIETINKINNKPIFRHGYVFRNESLLLFYCFVVDFYFMDHCQSLIKQWGSLCRCSIQELPRYFIALYEQWWRKQTHFRQKQNGVSLVVWSGNRSRRRFSPRSECGMEWKLGTASSSEIGKNIYDWDETCKACFIHVTVTNSRLLHYSYTVITFIKWTNRRIALHFVIRLEFPQIFWFIYIWNSQIKSRELYYIYLICLNV